MLQKGISSSSPRVPHSFSAAARAGGTSSTNDPNGFLLVPPKVPALAVMPFPKAPFVYVDLGTSGSGGRFQPVRRRNAQRRAFAASHREYLLAGLPL